MKRASELKYVIGITYFLVTFAYYKNTRGILISLLVFKPPFHRAIVE